MEPRFITHIKEGSLYHAVEIIRSGAEEQLFFTSIQKKKNALDIVEKCDDLSLETLSEKVKKNTPLFVIINTPDVLTKLIPSVKGDDLAVLNSAFPNIKTADIYYEWVACGKNNLVSVCRREHADAILKKMRDMNISVAGFSLGISRITPILSLIASEAVVLPSTRLTLHNNAIETIEKEEEYVPETYDIDSLLIEGGYLSGFSAVLSAIMKNRLTRSNFGELNTTLLSDVHNTRFFSFFLKFGLGILLGLLLANFFFFNHYYTKGEALQETVAIKSADKDQMLELRTRLEEKQKRIDAILASSSSKSTFYMDKIAAVLPASVLLKEMEYQPLEKQINLEKKILVRYNAIKISGASKDNTAFSDWLERMETWNWTTAVKIQDYHHNTVSVAAFTIWINIKNEE